MATRQTTIDHLLEQLGTGVSARKMFGEYGLYREGIMFGLVCDDRLFIKQTEAGRALLHTVEEAPPYPGAKNAFVIAEDDWDDVTWLRELTRVTARTLPPAKPKPAKTKAKAAKK